jgi:glycosyltransferase involved in cell wall biosynthesis
MSKFKVLINNLGGGGAERQVSYLFQGEKIKQIFTLNKTNVFPISEKNISSLCCKLSVEKKRNLPFLFLIVPFLLFSKLKKNEVVVSFLELSNFINILTACIFRRSRAVISVRVSPKFYHNKVFGNVYLFLMRKLYPLAELVITNSHEGRLVLLEEIELDPVKVIVIPNAVDIQSIRERQDESPVENLEHKEKLNIVMIGRISEQKNYIRFLNVYKNILVSGSKVRLIILGDGPLRECLIKHGENLGLSIGDNLDEADHDLYLMGFVKNPYRYINSKTLFILSSIYEGLPNVILEAMACGAVVVSADCSTGPREICAPDSNMSFKTHRAELAEFGLLLPVLNNMDAERTWGESLKEIINDPIQRNHYSNQSSKRVEAFSLDSVLNTWDKEISKLS